MWGLVTLAALLAWASSASAANLLTDTFTYPNGSLVGNDAWGAHSGAGVGPVQVSGGRILVRQATGANEDVNKPLPATRPATAKTYASFKLTVTDTTNLLNTTYFAHFRPAGADSNLFRARIHVARDSAVLGTYKIGISSGTVSATNTIVYFPGDYSVGQTHIVVSAYAAATGTSTLWVDPVSESSTNVSSTVAADGGRQIASYAFRQGTASGHTLTEAVDDLAVGDTFADAILSADIGLTSLCVTDSTKVCGTSVFTNQPWHILFSVINKGQKSVNNWSYNIVLQQSGSPVTIPIKTQVPGQPLLAGQGISINWPSPVIFASDQKGPWLVTVAVKVKEANQTDPTPTNDQRSFQFIVQNKFVPVSDLAVDTACVTLADSLKECADTLFTNQPWHADFSVRNRGNKSVDNWTFDLVLVNKITHVPITLKSGVSGPPLPAGAKASINWPSPYIFNTGDKAHFLLYVTVHVNDVGNPDADTTNNQKQVLFEVVNKPAAEVTDLAVVSVCAATADSAKQCTSTVFTNQPWHIMFTVRNQGNKPIFNWSFDIVLVDSLTGQVLPLKNQMAGPQIVPGTYTINWDSPFIFGTGQKGPWTVVVTTRVKDVGNPDVDPSNNSGSASFFVRNKFAPSDIGVVGLCVTLADTAKQCTPVLFTHQPWHIDFAVKNNGQKPVDNWSFYITLSRPGANIPLKTQYPGPPLSVGQAVSINWPSPRIFDSSEKGPWQIDVSTVIKDPGNPDFDPSNDRATVNFTVENKEPLPSDIGVHNLCAAFADSAKTCTDSVSTNEPWHIEFTVVNKGQKPVDRWNYFIRLLGPGGVVIPVNAHAEPLSWQLRASISDTRTGSGVEGGSASLISNKIYVSHGYRFGDSNLLSIYDIGTDTWTHGGLSAPNAAVVRSEMGGGVANGKHYAVGGRTGPNDQCEEFDPGSSTWTTMAPMSIPRAGAGVASSANKLYAIGGRSGGTFGTGVLYALNEEFDPTAGVLGTWTTKASVPIPVSDNYATIAYQGKVYVMGGATGPGTVISSVQIYDIGSDSWSAGAAMPTARGAAMAGVIDGKIAVFGGYDGSTNLNVTELYDPATNTWSGGPAMPAFVSEIAQGVTYDAKGIYSIGTGIFGASGSGVYYLTHAPAALPIGGSVQVNVDGPVFTSADKGPWTVLVDVETKETNNPDTSQVNNHAVDTFIVRNKVPPPEVTDIGVHDVCVTDSTKICTDNVLTRHPWHVLFTVVNKGQKAVDNWSFDIVLRRPGGAVVIPLKSQRPGPPLPLGGVATINWDPNYRFTQSSDKGNWEVVVTVAVKDSTNPDTSLSNNTAIGRFVVDNPTATLMSLFQAEPVSEGIELRWQFGEPQSIASAELERADAASGPWRAIAAERRDQGGVNVALDRDVQLGRTYYYRIIATTLGNERHVFGPLSGTAGASITEFALPRVAPNPTFGLTQLEFTLPREAPVRLSIVDVQGRVMAVLANGVHRAGRYQATWNGRSERGAAPVGVYLVVYQTPGKTFVRRLVLAR